MPPLSVVGIGEDGLDGLGRLARAVVDTAEVLAGGERHLAMVADDGRERLPWPRPLSRAFDTLAARLRRGRRVCILASGDPLCYGIGRLLLTRFRPAELRFFPAPSAFSLACARLGWNQAEVEMLSLHSRPPATLQGFIQPGARLLLLTGDGDTPATVATMLSERGYGASRLTVLEHLGGVKERQRQANAAVWADEIPRCAELNTLAVECVADPGARLLARTPGLADDAFEHDGQLTKRELRAVTLARLMPVGGQLLWDVGAGCGSVAIEWLRAARNARAVAVERDPGRAALVLTNAARLGTPELRLIEGEAPAALAGLEPPDAVFIGGGLSQARLFASCWRRLRPGGRLVANAVTVEGEAMLARWQQRLGGELTRLNVARAAPVGSFLGWRPLLPVSQLALVK